jgi:hypothetical protein
MERFVVERGVTVTTGMEMTNDEAVEQAVEAGLGLGIVSIHTMELELETVRLVLLETFDVPNMRHW